MSPDPGSWENQRASGWMPENKAELERDMAEMNRALARIEAEHQKSTDQQGAWAHWEYTPEEWALLDRLDWGSAVRRRVLTVGPAMLACFVFTVPLVLSVLSLSPILIIISFLVWFAAFLWLTLVAPPSRAFRWARKRHQARQNTSPPQKVTLSGQGLWIAGTYFPLAGSGIEKDERKVALREVRLSTQPPMLHFRVERHFSNGKGVYPIEETIPLLVPQAYESEAKQIAHRYRTEVVVSQISERERKRAEQEAREHPPEPI